MVHHHDPAAGCSGHVTASQARPFIDRTWDLDRWKRKSGEPKPDTIAAYRHKLHCAAGPGHRRAIKNHWQHRKRAFYEHRRAEIWRRRFTPYDCTGGPSAIPCYITACESGDSYTAENPSGAYGRYQLMPEWWSYLGRKPTPAEQDRIASELWDGGAGAANWLCA